MIDAEDDLAFPLDPWSVLPAEARAAPNAPLAAGVAQLVAHYAAPRDEVLVRRFLVEALPAGRLCLYGAGSFTARVLDWLRARPDIEVAGIIDRNAAALGRFHGLPVITPEDLAATVFDLIVIAHPVHEMDMQVTLLESGIAASRIFRVFDNPEFGAMALPVRRSRIDAALCVSKRYCIVGTSHLSTVPDDALCRVFPPAETMMLVFSPYEAFRESAVYATLDLASSTSLLAEALRRLAPSAVMLRSTSHLGFLAAFIKMVLPQTILLHDFYDFTNLLPASLLHGWLAMSPEQVTINQLAEYHSLRTGDLALSKRDGPWWTRMLGPTAKPYVSYFPGIAQDLPPLTRPVKQPDVPWRLLYAGILLQPKPGEYTGDYNFLHLFEALAASGRFVFDLYNSAHRDESQDAAFSYFIDRYPTAPIHYHRCIPYPALHARSGPCDFGWLYREAGGEVSYDAATAVPARFLGYLNAGLPVILDDKWGYLEELVIRHHAGIILPQGEGSRLPDLLAACDLERLQTGARALLRHCIDHNEAAIARIRRYLRHAGQRGAA